MDRRISLVIASLLAVALLGSGCQRKVEVETGTRVLCKYGHTITDNVSTEKVPAKDAAGYRVTTLTRVCPKHEQIAALYGEAQVALQEGDSKTARSKLEQLVALDPSFAKARTQLDQLKSGETPQPDRDGGLTPTGNTKPSSPKGDAPSPDDKTPGDGDRQTPSGKMTAWTPDNLNGYTATKPAIDVLSIAREYVPDNSDRILLVIVVDQQKTSAGAKEQLEYRVRRAYPQDGASVTVNGHKAYFGTDGASHAAIGFVSGSQMVALELTSKSSGSPAGMKSELIAATKQLP